MAIQKKEYIEIAKYVRKKRMNDEWFYKDLDLFNQFYVWHCGWNIVIARKDHIDENGFKIKWNEEYYKLKYGAGWNDVYKMSRRSMESLLLCFLNGNLGKNSEARAIKAKREDRLREEIYSFK